MNTLQKFRKEMEPYKNTLVLDFWNVVLLKDVIEGVDDLCWIYYGSVSGDRREYYSSCVCEWIALKGVIPDAQYERLVYVWNLNHEKDHHAV